LNETSACRGNVYFEIWGTEVQLEFTKLHTFSIKNISILIFAVRKIGMPFHIIRNGCINP
jgi:hypothetical protein